LAEKTETSRQNILLPKAEWEAFTDEVRKLIRADEELLDAHNRILTVYDQLLNAYEQLLRESQKPSRVRGFFGRRQTQQAQVTTRPCPYCRTPLEPRDRFCPACGRTTEQAQETFPSIRYVEKSPGRGWRATQASV